MDTYTGTHLYRDIPRGTVVIVHGMGEHSGRYAHVIDALTGNGYAVVAGDLPGFGRSPGPRGHIDDFGTYLRAVSGWLDHARMLPGMEALPLYLMGHSLGGLVAYRYCQGSRCGINGLILSSPVLRLRVRPPAWKTSAARLLNAWVPGFSMDNGVKAEQLTSDAAVAEAYRTDPLNYGKVSARWYTELVRNMDAAVSQRIPDLPILLILGGGDPLVDSGFLAGHFGAGMGKTVEGAIRINDYPGFLHEPLNESERGRVIGDLLEWLKG